MLGTRENFEEGMEII